MNEEVGERKVAYSFERDGGLFRTKWSLRCPASVYIYNFVRDLKAQDIDSVSLTLVVLRRERGSRSDKVLNKTY